MTYPRCSHENHQDENGMGGFDGGPSDPAERAKVPYQLSESIRDAVEAAERGDVREQATVGEFTP